MSANANISLHSDVSYMLTELEAAGFEAYVVGGFVRDALRGKPAGDCDVTTSALPEEIKRVFSHLRTIDTGIKHGTVTVMYRKKPYEITTYRVDGSYADSRHPDEVSFTASLEDDLARRDFTVNAMAYSEVRGLVDIFGGRADLESKTIRAVGDPSTRFSEDALRILRAVRFASVLDFEIDEATRAAIFTEAHRLASVSAERKLVELRKLLTGEGAYRILTGYSDLISQELSGIERISLPKESDFAILSGEDRLITLFYLSAEDPASAFCDSMRRLKSDKQSERFGSSVLSVMSDDLAGDRLYERILDDGIAVVNKASELLALFGRASESERLAALMSNGRPTTLRELAIDGKTLMEFGVKGREVGILLRRAVIAVMRGDVENDREEIIRYIKTGL